MEKFRAGHQAPKGRRVNTFNSIEISGDLAYCKSHNFVYNIEEEKQKLYNGQACYYTDIRFIDGDYNFYENCKLHWTRWKDISLEACIRKTLNCYNIPVGTIVSFNKSWYYTDVKIDNSYNFIVKKENKKQFNFEINKPAYFNQFINCEFSKELTTALRENGFIVRVEQNESFLTNMINSATLYTGRGNLVDASIEGDIAFAYGHGKKIGFSSFNNDFMGYTNGCNNILWDWHDEFNKWSQACQIDKKMSITEIIEILKQPVVIEV